MQQPSEPLSHKRGLIVAVLIGVNILCLAAIAAVSGKSKPEPAAVAATQQTTKKEAESAAPAKAAEAKEADKAAEPSAAADAPKGKAEPAAADEKAEAKADAKDSSRAVVTLPPGRANGVLRAKPDPRSGLVTKLPAGTVVEVSGKRAVGNQTWYEVKTVDFKPESTGWMHENVLKMQ